MGVVGGLAVTVGVVVGGVPVVGELAVTVGVVVGGVPVVGGAARKSGTPRHLGVKSGFGRLGR